MPPSDYQLRRLALIPLPCSPETGLTSHCESDKLSRGNIPFASSDQETTTVKGALL